MQLINPIKQAMVDRLTANKVALGLKTIDKDIALDAIADEVEKLAPFMPAAFVVYYGRSAREEGTFLVTTMTFALVVAARSLMDAHVSDPIATEILDATLDLFQGKTISPLQRAGFSFAGETLQHKDKVLTIYQQLFNTDVALDFRSALNSQSP